MKESTIKEHRTLNELKELSHRKDFKFKMSSLNFQTPLKKFLDTCNENFESMILHKNLYEQESQKECSIILLKGKLIKSPVITSSIQTNQISIIEIKRLFDIDLEQSGNYYFIKILYIKDISVDNLAKITLKFDNHKEAQIFKYFVEKEKINCWQQFFETETYILEPFFYQYHFFLKKVNSRGDQENRVIVLTNEFILNIDYQIIITKKNDITGNEFVFKLHKPKWALCIKSFEELQLIEKDKKKKTNYFMIKIKINQKENKNYVNEKKLPFKNKSSTDFIFQNEKICRFFIFQIKRLYYNIFGDKKFIKITEC
jgi:hypothetical protein